MTELSDKSSHTFDDILMPLAIAVVIDHKVRIVEEATLVEQANGLLELFGHSPLPAGEILGWFDSRKDALEDQLWEKGGNTLVLKALTRFDEPKHREAIYDALIAITIADSEYAKEESRLIKSAAAIYGFERPPFKVKRD